MKLLVENDMDNQEALDQIKALLNKQYIVQPSEPRVLNYYINPSEQLQSRLATARKIVDNRNNGG